MHCVCNDIASVFTPPFGMHDVVCRVMTACNKPACAKGENGDDCENNIGMRAGWTSCNVVRQRAPQQDRRLVPSGLSSWAPQHKQVLVHNHD